MLDTIKYLSGGKPDTTEAFNSANKVLATIQKRQKLIKLADKCEAGWLTVEKYESDELADKSEEEKRVKKAQDKASRKKKQLSITRLKRQKSVIRIGRLNDKISNFSR